MKEISLKHLYLLYRMKRNPITQEQVQIVYRKAQNLQATLISGLINQSNNRPYRCVPCRDIRTKQCISCNRINWTNNMTIGNKIHKIRGYFNCQTENCIYCLTCNCCRKRYIGETSQTVNNRLHGHESHIRNYLNHP